MGGASEADWIGIDVGATSVKAYAVTREPAGRLAVRGEVVELALDEEHDFRPRPLEEQLAQVRAGQPSLTERESAAAKRRVDAVAAAVKELCLRSGADEVRLALCAPGRTDPTRRGLVALRNGPRDPLMLDRLAAALRQRGLMRAQPPRAIESDGTAAGWGEEHGVDGAFASVASAYAVGCGTGVSEALKLRGELLEPASFPAPWPEPWRAGSDGACAEERFAMPALLRRWRTRAGGRAPTRPAATRLPGDDRNSGSTGAFPEPAARAGDPLAVDLLRVSAEHLANFLAGRLGTLAVADIRLERVVLGQRAAPLLADPGLATCFARPLRSALARCLESGPAAGAYAAQRLRAPGFLVPSRLRAAPALGAVALALREHGGA